MPSPNSASILALSGRNGGDPATHVGDNEFPVLTNYYPIRSRVRRRAGYSKVINTPAVEDLTSLFAYKENTGDWQLLVGGLTQLYRLDGLALTLIPRSDGGGVAYTSETRPWSHSQYKDVAYHSRQNTGTLKRGKSDYMQDAGIDAPATVPTLADGGAGALSAADYYGVVTFYNTETGAESNPSEASTVLSLGASKQIAWSGIPVSTNGQVNARRLYRTLPDQQGVYFFVAEVGDNFTTTYTDNVTDADLGDEVSFRNGLPPANIRYNVVHKERLWLSDGVDLFYSEQFKPESYYSNSVIQITPDDGHQMRGLHSYGDRLVVGKTNGIHFVTGTSEANFGVSVLTNRHGLYSHHSMKNAQGLLFWYGGDDFYVSDGVTVESISDPKVKDLIDAIPDDMKEYVVAAIEPSLGWYMASIASGSGQTTNNYMLVYNYRDKTWAVFQYAAGAPRFIGDFYSSSFGLLPYAVFYDDYIYQLNDGLTDAGTAISAEFRTKQFGFGGDALYKALRHFSILCTSVAGTMTFNLYRDGSATPHRTRAVSLNQTGLWKRVALSNVDQAATLVQVGAVYAGTPALDIEGFAYEMVNYDQRRSVAL